MSPSSDSYIEDDKVLSATDRHLMFRLLGFVLPYWRLIVVSSLLSLSMALLQLAGPWIVKLAIDDHIAIGDYAGVARLSVWFAATVVAMFGFEYVQGFLVTWVGQKGMFDLRAKLFGHLQDLPVAFFDRTPVGRIMTRLTGDVQSLNELFAQGVMTLAGDVFLLLAIVALMLWTDAKLACIVFVTIPILVAVGQIYRVKAREAFRDVRTRLSLLNTYLQENISGIRTVQAYNREALNFQRFSELNDSHREANLRSVFYLAVFFPAVEFVAALGLALIIWYGGGQAVSGAITLGTLVLFIQYTQRLFQPIRDLTEKFNIFQAAVAAAERIFKLLDTPATVVSPPEPVPVKTVGREIALAGVAGSAASETPQPRARVVGAAPADDPCSRTTDGGCILLPLKLVDASPIYPPVNLANGLAGQVVIDARVLADGSVGNLQPVPGGDPEFVAAATEAMRLWKFSPVHLDGTPIDMSLRVTVRFELERR